MYRTTRINLAISLLIIAIAVAAIAPAHAGEPRQARQGFFIGADLGLGGSHLEWEKDGQKYESGDDDGGAAGIRIGYAFNPYFSLSFDARGYGHEGDEQYSIGTTTLSATIYPMGGGFFIRLSGGQAYLETEVEGDDVDPLFAEFKEHGGTLGLGLGYDWMVSEHAAIGLSLESRGVVIEDFDDFDEVTAGESTIGANMTFYF